jgi:5'-methylthioadenosine phosphorylase
MTLPLAMGYPSSPLSIASLPSGKTVAFRHGTPSSVPFQINIAALKSLGVRVILASAIGSLCEDIPRGSFFLPTQIMDHTKGVRPSIFFDGTTVVAHAAFGDPFGLKLVGVE